MNLVCPHCGQAVEVPSHLAGSEVDCCYCQKPFTAPSSAPVTAAVPQPPAYFVIQPAAAPPGNGLGVAGFVLGLLGLLLCWVPILGIVLAILGACLSIPGVLVGTAGGVTRPIGLAIAGMVLSLIAILITILVIAAVFSGRG